MAWTNILTTMVRHLIGDTSASPDYTDDEIQTAVVTGALIACQEFKFDTIYVFNLETPNITPDPTSSANLDNLAIALFSLKAACMLNTNAYQQAIKSGIKVRDGDSAVDTTGGFGGYSDILKLGPCKSYEKLLNELRYKRSMMAGKSVMTPIVHGDFLLTGLHSISRFFDSLSRR